MVGRMVDRMADPMVGGKEDQKEDRKADPMVGRMADRKADRMVGRKEDQKEDRMADPMVEWTRGLNFRPLHRLVQIFHQQPLQRFPQSLVQCLLRQLQAAQMMDRMVGQMVAVMKAQEEGHLDSKGVIRGVILPHFLLLGWEHLLRFSATRQGRQTQHRVDFRREHLFVLLLIVQQMFFFPPSITPHTGHMARLK